MYVSYNANPDNLIVGDCTVRAIAKLMETDWGTAYLGVTAQGYKMKNMSVDNAVWGAYLTEHGYKRHRLPDTCPDCYTVADFCRDNPKGRYLLATGRHTVAVVDGAYYDTWNSGDETAIYYYSKED